MFDSLSISSEPVGAFCWDFSFHSSECIHVYGYTCYAVTVTVYSLLHLLIDTLVAIAGTDIAAAPQLESERILKQQKDTQVQKK